MSGRLLRRLPLQAFSTLLQHRHIYTPITHNNSTSSSSSIGTTDSTTTVSLSAYLLALRDTIISLKSTPCSQKPTAATSISHNPTPLPTHRTDATDHTDSSWVDIPTLNLPPKCQNYDPAALPKHSSSGGGENTKMRCESPIMSNLTDYTSLYPGAAANEGHHDEEAEGEECNNDVHPAANTTTQAYQMNTVVEDATTGNAAGAGTGGVAGCEVGYWERQTKNTTHAHHNITKHTHSARTNTDTKMNCDDTTSAAGAYNNDDTATITSAQPSLSSTLFSHQPRLPPVHTPHDAPTTTTTRAPTSTTTTNGLHIPGIQAPKKEVINLTTSYPPTAPVSLCKTFKEFKIQLTSSTTSTSTTPNTTNMTTPTDRYTGNWARHNKGIPTTTSTTGVDSNNGDNKYNSGNSAGNTAM